MPASTMTETARAHDLLWIAGAAALEGDEPLPAWTGGGWLERAPVVVRREATAPGRIPVGLRGLRRSERHQAYVAAAAVGRRVTPENLAAGRAWQDWRPCGDNRALATLATLADVAPRLDDGGFAWGPTGGVGFAVASGLPVLRADSDLDLLVRSPVPLTHAQREQLARLSNVARCRIDLQIDTGRGAFAFAEWQAGRRRVLVKTDAGPVLAADPWQPPTS